MKAARAAWSSQSFAHLALDGRGLAVFRILLSGFLVCFSLESIFVAMRDGNYALSQIPAHAAIGLFALPFALGYKTRLATILTWLSTRAAFWGGAATDYGMVITQLMLFWSMFLPLGDACSLDRRGKPPEPPRNVLSMASAAFLIQLFVVYFSAGITKNLDDWLYDPVALEVILRNPRFGTGLGQYLAAHYPGLLGVLSVATILVEVVGPFLLFVPTPNQWGRTVLAVTYIAFHVGLILTMDLGLFPFICIAAWVAVLPAPVWNWLGARLAWGPPSQLAVVPWSPVQIFVAAAILFVFFANAVSLNRGWYEYTPVQVIYDAGKPLGLPQQWIMFNRPREL